MNLLKILRESIISIVIISIFWVSYAALSSLIVSTNDTLTAQKWNDLVQHAVPSKSVMAFYDTVCPAWWIPADGTNSTPDLRWEFIRWFDNWRWIDLSRNFGSLQLDSLQDHDHYISWENAWLDNVVSFQDTNVDGQYASNAWTNRGDTYIYVRFVKNGRVSTETRPRNVALLYCMKN